MLRWKKGLHGSVCSLFHIFSSRYWFSEKIRHFLFTEDFLRSTAIIYWRFPHLPPLILIFNLGKSRTVGNKKSLFEKLTKKQKNKKIYSSRCDLGASIECELLSEHSMHSDYWHKCHYIFFIFRPFSSINKDFYFHGSSVFNELN